jgi:hypothetical protein
MDDQRQTDAQQAFVELKQGIVDGLHIEAIIEWINADLRRAYILTTFWLTLIAALLVIDIINP